MSDNPSIHWIPLTADWAYNEQVCREAAAAGVTAIQFSHTICHTSTQLDDPDRRDPVRKLLKLYRDAGLDVWCWTHEVNWPDERFVRDGKLLADEDGLYKAIEARYDRFLTETLPGLKGLVLTLAETSFSIYQDESVISDCDPATRVRRVVDAVAAACRRQGARLAVRDFVHRKSELDGLREMFQGLPGDIILMTKCVPHDWQPFYPANPMIGEAGDREQWIEHDFGFEYEGQHLYPYADLEKIEERMRYEQSRGIRTWCLRLDRYNADKGCSALLTPWGRLLLDAAKRIAEDPDLELETVWDDWEQSQFIGARTVLNISTQAVQLMLFSLGAWTNNHSRLPVYAYARSHSVRIDATDRPENPETASEKALALVIDRMRSGWTNIDRMAGWTNAPEDWALEEAMESMTDECLEQCLEEAHYMQFLAGQARECIESIDDGGPDAAAWEQAVEQLVVWAYCFGAWKRAYFHVRHCQEHPSKKGVKQCEKLIKAFEKTCAEAAPALKDVFLGNGPVCEDGALGKAVAKSLREALSVASED